MTELDKKLAKAARECSAGAVRRTFEADLPQWFKNSEIVKKEQR